MDLDEIKTTSKNKINEYLKNENIMNFSNKMYSSFENDNRMKNILIILIVFGFLLLITLGAKNEIITIPKFLYLIIGIFIGLWLKR
jgi:uncharacterized membrane protein